MKLFIIILSLLISKGCQGVIGSEENETIYHVEMSIGNDDYPNGYYVSNNSLSVYGMIKNIGDTTILAPWSVEAEFYADSTFSEILGGNQQSFNVNLEVGVSRKWTLEYSSNDIVESNYPNFAIKNFRAFIRK